MMQSSPAATDQPRETFAQYMRRIDAEYAARMGGTGANRWRGPTTQHEPGDWEREPQTISTGLAATEWAGRER